MKKDHNLNKVLWKFNQNWLKQRKKNLWFHESAWIYQKWKWIGDDDDEKTQIYLILLLLLHQSVLKIFIWRSQNHQMFICLIKITVSIIQVPFVFIANHHLIWNMIITSNIILHFIFSINTEYYEMALPCFILTDFYGWNLNFLYLHWNEKKINIINWKFCFQNVHH